MQFPVATLICIVSVSFLLLIPKGSDTAIRSTPLLPFMDQPIEVDDQEPGRTDDEPTDEGMPRTSSEPEHHSGSEESK